MHKILMYVLIHAHETTWRISSSWINPIGQRMKRGRSNVKLRLGIYCTRCNSLSLWKPQTVADGLRRLQIFL